MSADAPPSDPVTATFTAARDNPRSTLDRVQRLCIVAPAEIAGTVVVTPGCTVGRELADDVVRVEHRTVSRRHLNISAAADGAALVADLGSRNGTWVDGTAVGSIPRALEHGSVVRLGEVVAVYEAGARPEPTGQTEPADRIPGHSLAAAHLRARIERTARAGGTTLIEGESGTGKEFVASELHRLSNVQGPYIVANCAALSTSLADSQLFGHERGAFTGAVSSHRGYLRSADGGTLFLDEIGELPLELQPKLLRGVELGEVVPLGGTSVTKVKTRIVAATNRTLSAEVAGGRFRRDLFARLSLQRIEVPPLRERRADFIVWYELLHHRWQSAHGSTEVQSASFTAEALEALLLQPWRENLRGLDQLVHGVGALLMARGAAEIALADIQPWLGEVHQRDRSAAPRAPEAAVTAAPRVRPPKPPKPTRATFIEVMEQLDWNVRAASRHFDRDRRQIYRWIEQFGLARPDGSD